MTIYQAAAGGLRLDSSLCCPVYVTGPAEVIAGKHSDTARITRPTSFYVLEAFLDRCRARAFARHSSDPVNQMPPAAVLLLHARTNKIIGFRSSSCCAAGEPASCRWRAT